MKLKFDKGFYTLNFGYYERHFLSHYDLIVFLTGVNLLIQQN
jgi:hypothetical protein